MKIPVLAGLYLVIAPLIGFLARKRIWAQYILFFIICFMIIQGFLHPGEWGLTLENHLYRGHARGYHFYFIEVPVIALLCAQIFGNFREFRFFPSGLGWYLLYCGASLISWFNAPFPEFTQMAAFKFLKVTLLFVAAWNFFKTEKQLHFFCVAMCCTMIWEMLAVLKMKYLDHIYQVYGTFEHQNALSMFTTMIGMVFLAMALGPKRQFSWLYLLGFIACGIASQSTLSRAGLVVFAFGAAMVTLCSLIDKPTLRRWCIAGGLGAVAGIGLAFTIDTIIARFNDYGNDESKRTRDLLNAASRHMLRDYPLGIGWNNFAATINRPFPYGYKIEQWQKEAGNPVDKKYPKGVVESHYYLLLSETGYQGLASYLILITIFLWWNWRAMLCFRYHPLGCLSLGIAMGCGLNYVQSVLERVLTQPRNLMLWMILLAATSKIETWRKIEKERRKLAVPRKQSSSRPARRDRELVEA